MKVATEFDLGTAEWGEPVNAQMGIRIETRHGTILVTERADGCLSIQALDGFLIVVPFANNHVAVRARYTVDGLPFGKER